MKITWLQSGGILPDVSTTLLDSDAVVIQADLNTFTSTPDVLANEERQKADSFTNKAQRLRYLTGRSILRQIMAPIVGETPKALRFSYGQKGKPYLANYPNLHFNLAHSGSFLTIALSQKYPVGIDVEIPRPVPEWRDISRNWANIDRNWIETGPNPEQNFIKVWTAREAILKSFGHGIAELDKIEEVAVCTTTSDFLPLISTPWGEVSLHTRCGDSGEYIALGINHLLP